jgi:hypothetical protein
VRGFANDHQGPRLHRFRAFTALGIVIISILVHIRRNAPSLRIDVRAGFPVPGTRRSIEPRLRDIWRALE